MYSNANHNFENELLKAEIAKADQLAKAVSTTELDPHDALRMRFISSPHTACVSCVWWHSKWETAKPAQP